MTINPTAAIPARVVKAPELRFTNAGKAMTRLTVACSTRRKNPAGEWEDGPATFVKVRCFDRVAEHVAESDLQPGDAVLLTGELGLGDPWTGKDGQLRQDVELLARTVAVDLHRCPVRLQRIDRHDQAVRDQRHARATGHGADPWTDQTPAPF